MSKNFAAIKSHYAASDAKDLAGMLAPLTADTRWTEMAGFPYAGTYVGPDAVVEGVFKRIGEDWPDFALKVESLHDAGDTIFAIGAYSGTNKATGKPMKARVVHVWKMKDGKAVSFEQFADTALVAKAMAN